MNGPRRYIVDTNILLRFLIGDSPTQSAAAHKLIARANAGEIVLEVSPVIVAETLYTMLSFYRAERKSATEQLSLLLQQHGIDLHDSNAVLAALKRLQTSNVGFADAFLAAQASERRLPVASFDRDFDKFKGITRYEPAP